MAVSKINHFEVCDWTPNLARGVFKLNFRGTMDHACNQLHQECKIGYIISESRRYIHPKLAIFPAIMMYVSNFEVKKCHKVNSIIHSTYDVLLL